MSNYKFYIYGKYGCPYFINSINLLQSLDNKEIIYSDSICNLISRINTDFNIDEILLNINSFNKHKTSPLILYGDKKKLLFIGGNDKLVDLIKTIEKNDKNIIEKINELYGGDDIISVLIKDLKSI